MFIVLAQILNYVRISNLLIVFQCFSLGAEIGSHKNDHSYQFMVNFSIRLLKYIVEKIVIIEIIYFKDSGAFGIFLGRTSWSANEEVRLLDAIEQFGFGNWEDIAKHIETRTPEGNYYHFIICPIV